MKKFFWISRIILPVIAWTICMIATVNEDISMRILPPLVIAAIVLLLTFPGERISSRMIAVGDDIRKGWRRTLFYILMLPVMLLLAFIAIILISNGGNGAQNLSQGLMVVFFEIVAAVVFLVPYVMMVLVLALRKGSKKTEDKTELRTNEDEI